MTPQELKNSILQLAIQGRLVEQRPEEGTAEELYAQIQAEKAQLIREKKIKKDKPLPEITEEELPFDIPESWKWVRLGAIISLISGQDLTPDKYNSNNNGIPYITGASNIQNGYIDISRWTTFATSKAIQGDLLLTCKGTVGTMAFLQEREAHIARQIMAMRTEYSVELRYIKIFLESFVGILKSKAKSMIPGVSRSDIIGICLPLPPLAEQKRIVAKIEELLPYIDRYEQAWSKLEDFNKKFPTDMQKSILQMAIQGRLVEQRPQEGTAEELYVQIQAEKAQLIKDGKIKKQKPLPEITEDEVPFEIPESWKWVRLGEIFVIIRGSSPRPKGSPLYWSKDKTRFNWITIKDISAYVSQGKLYETTEHLTEKGAELSTYVGKDELIIAVSGSTTGKHCVLGIDGYIYDGLAAILNPTKIIGSQFIAVFFDWIYEKLNAQKIGSAFPNINTDILKHTLIPLPPLAEQQRIVAKLEEILPLCEGLKS